MRSTLQRKSARSEMRHFDMDEEEIENKYK